LPRARLVLELLASCVVYSVVVMLVTFVVILVFTQELGRILLFLTYALLLEGGVALVTGGVVASFSPIVEKIGESVVHSKPWDARRLKEAERQARVWILTGSFLFLFGLLVSAI
jgi:hypothetical protein